MGVLLRPGHAFVLRRWESVLLHAVRRLGVTSLLDGVQRGLLHPRPWHLRDVPEDVLRLHGGAVPAIARHRLRFLWCEVLPRQIRRRRCAAPKRVKAELVQWMGTTSCE